MLQAALDFTASKRSLFQFVPFAQFPHVKICTRISLFDDIFVHCLLSDGPAAALCIKQTLHPHNPGNDHLKSMLMLCLVTLCL